MASPYKINISESEGVDHRQPTRWTLTLSYFHSVVGVRGWGTREQCITEGRPWVREQIAAHMEKLRATEEEQRLARFERLQA